MTWAFLVFSEKYFPHLCMCYTFKKALPELERTLVWMCLVLVLWTCLSGTEA